MPHTPDVPPGEVSALYNAANKFYLLAPWQWMDDTSLFAVRNPEDGELGFCTVMGNLGEHFALGMYRGARGLFGYTLLQNAGARIEPMEFFQTQDLLMASFEDRKILSKDDLGQIRELGLKFRGAHAWPLFRSYIPGHEPWFLTAAEARFLTIALQQAVEVARRILQDPDGFTLFDDSRLLCRTATLHNGSLVWQDDWIDLPVYTPPQPAPLIIDDQQLADLATMPSEDMSVEIGLFPLPRTVLDATDDRPWFPMVVIAADHRTKLILGMETVAPPDAAQTAADALIKLVEQLHYRPSELRVQDRPLYEALKPVTDQLRMPMRLTKGLSAVSHIRKSMLKYLGVG